MTEVSETSHPLHRIEDWIASRPEGQIATTELYGDGPTSLHMSKAEFSEWVHQGIALQMFAVDGLASIVKVVSRESNL